MSKRRIKAIAIEAVALGSLLLWGLCAWASPTPPRIITLTPHATELVFAAGGGQHVVATVDSSNYPPAAAALPKVGNGLTSSVEEILSHRPDWVIGWPSPLTRQIQSLGVKVWVSDPQSLEDIATEIQAMAQRFGDPKSAATWVKTYRTELAKLGEKPLLNKPLRAMVLASSDGRYVIGQHGLINEALLVCGMRNVFEDARAPALQISQEGLLAAKPDVIISSEPMISKAVVSAPVFAVNADWLYRPGPRFMKAVTSLCDIARQAREHAKKQLTP